MRHYRLMVILAALLLGACGANQPAQEATAPTIAAAATTAATAAPTTAATQAATTTPTVAATGAVTTTADAAPTDQPFLGGKPKPAAINSPSATDAPTDQPAPTPEPAPAGGPTRIVIGDINLDYQPVSVGLDKNRVPIVPDHDVGWYNLSAGPGQGENIVLWGHVLRFRATPNIPAPFARVKELKPGASVVLYDQAGKAHNYKVTKQIWVLPNEVDYILPQSKEIVTMVSCIGDKVIQGGEVVDESHRLITVAEPA